MSGYGIKVSEPGYDVLTAGEENLQFTSEYATFKFVQSGGGTFDSSGIATINHGLGYTPVAFVYRESAPADNKRYFLSVQTGDVNGGFGAETTTLSWDINGSNLYIRGDENADYSYLLAADFLNIFGSVGDYVRENDVGIRISQDGYDVLTDSDAYMSLIGGGVAPKIAAQGYVNVGSAPETIGHSLGYYPFFLIWKKYSGSWYQRSDPSSAVYADIDAYVNTSNLVINDTGEFFYVIYYDELV